MKAYEESTEGSVLALPHIGNLSTGLIFDNVTPTGKPRSKNDAERGARSEPIDEVTQILRRPFKLPKVAKLAHQEHTYKSMIWETPKG